jgi:hypothetical protein
MLNMISLSSVRKTSNIARREKRVKAQPVEGFDLQSSTRVSRIALGGSTIPDAQEGPHD